MIRKAGFNDILFIWHVRNELSVRENSFNSECILYTDHIKFMSKNLCNYWIIVFRDKSAGFIRIDKNGEISIAISEAFRRKGIGMKAIKEIVLMVNKPLTAKIKFDNLASMKIFRRNRFKIIVQRDGYEDKYLCLKREIK